MDLVFPGSDLVRSICCSPNGSTLVSGSYDKTLKVWEVDTGQELWTLKGHGYQQYLISKINAKAPGNFMHCTARLSKWPRIIFLEFAGTGSCRSHSHLMVKYWHLAVGTILSVCGMLTLTVRYPPFMNTGTGKIMKASFICKVNLT
jgi:WD40 repeat protein